MLPFPMRQRKERPSATGIPRSKPHVETIRSVDAGGANRAGLSERLEIHQFRAQCSRSMLMLVGGSRSGSRDGSSRCRSSAAGAPPADSAGNSSAHRETSHPLPPCAESAPVSGAGHSWFRLVRRAGLPVRSTPIRRLGMAGGAPVGSPLPDVARHVV